VSTVLVGRREVGRRWSLFGDESRSPHFRGSEVGSRRSKLSGQYGTSCGLLACQIREHLLFSPVVIISEAASRGSLSRHTSPIMSHNPFSHHSDPSGPTEPPPAYSKATQQDGHLAAPANNAGADSDYSSDDEDGPIPQEARRSMEDEMRELPPGWRREFDAK